MVYVIVIPGMILENYPTLEREDIYACIKFASELMHNNYTIAPVVA
jgi:uncharacterized protein (DUF433 family)